MLSRRFVSVAVAVLVLPFFLGGPVAARAGAPAQPAPSVDHTDPTKGTHLRLGLLLSKGSVTPTLQEIDRGFTSSLRTGTGPLVLRLRDSAGAVLDTLTMDDPLVRRVYDAKREMHGTATRKEATIVVDLPVIDTAVVVEVTHQGRRIGTLDVGSLIQACQGRPLPCAFS
ncbi:hypothetical protein [Asanoa siamensis]|uniref:Uncharacterized protein n=1 Tax=Asanoa siamensis TaxID=926357 RepID=A0ABQ4CMD8_9ACTN|nr:hypothetical protein [Asanoa siamensis]GIF72448.1 hypothetical protein Asi02nite_19660 [Asanoa siamensis]